MLVLVYVDDGYDEPISTSRIVVELIQSNNTYIMLKIVFQYDDYFDVVFL